MSTALRISPALQPLDQLLAVTATLAGHGIQVSHSLYAHHLPRALYDALPGEREHEFEEVPGRGPCEWWKTIDFAPSVALTLYTSEPPREAE